MNIDNPEIKLALSKSIRMLKAIQLNSEKPAICYPYKNFSPKSVCLDVMCMICVSVVDVLGGGDIACKQCPLGGKDTSYIVCNKGIDIKEMIQIVSTSLNVDIKDVDFKCENCESRFACYTSRLE